MLNKLLVLLSLSFALNACSTKDNNRNRSLVKNEFASFEMSYTDGWKTSFGFFLDSNKVFLASTEFDSIHYGILPDSLYIQLNRLAKEIKNKSVKFHDVDCQDCEMISIRMTISNDTVNIVQTKSIDSQLVGIARPIDSFLRRHSQKIHSHLNLPTQSFGVPPPIPANEQGREILFQPLKH